MNPGVLAGFGRQASAADLDTSSLGSLRPAITSRIVQEENGREWLLSKQAVAYEGKYSPLLDGGHMHMLTASATNQKSLTLSNSASGVRPAAMLFWSASASKYLLVSPGDSSASPASEHAVGASIAALTEAGYSGTSNGCTDAAQFSDGSVVTLHGGTTTNAGNRFPGATFTPANLSFGTDNRFCVAANGATGVACGNNQSNATNDINVSTDSGATWAAAVTGSNGDITSIAGLHWSPCANAFMWFGTSSTGYAVLTSTTAAPQTQTTRYNAVQTPPTCGRPWRAASSPSVTLLALNGRKILRTTDGTTFAEVYPEVAANWQFVAADSVATRTAVAYDPGTGYFFCWLDESSANHIPGSHVTNANVLRSLDGVAWEPCISVEQETSARSSAGFLFANGLKLMAVSTTTNEINQLRDVSAVLANAPQFVRASAAYFNSATPPIQSQVRIK